MELKRTSKEFNAENLTEDFVRSALSIVGLHSFPSRKDEYQFPVDFVVENLFHWVKDRATSTYFEDEVEYNEEKEADGWVLTPNGVLLSVGTFDTQARVWESGRVQGNYRKEDGSRGGLQFPADQLKWVNLLLKHGFVE